MYMYIYVYVYMYIKVQIYIYIYEPHAWAHVNMYIYIYFTYGRPILQHPPASSGILRHPAFRAAGPEDQLLDPSK